MTKPQNILTVNAGSSSLKCVIYRSDGRVDAGDVLWKGQVDFRSADKANLTCEAGGEKFSEDLPSADRREAGERICDAMFGGKCGILKEPAEVGLVGHRVVHGSSKYESGTLITEEVLADLRQWVDLAPLHEQANIEGIAMARNRFKEARQVAVFDTAFHRTMPESARVYPGPYKWYEEHDIQRFGFHGISHQYLAGRAEELMQEQGKKAGKIITCHIGNGASLCAIKEGKCVMTTMGYTPLDGLVMGTRSGSIDPGLVLHLLQHSAYTVEELDDVLNHQSGLKGISGLSSDMRDIEKAMSQGLHRAVLAFQIYVDRMADSIASLVPRLGGLDALVFAGGVGENSSSVRAAVCGQLDFMGVKIELAKNQKPGTECDITAADSKVTTFVIHTREDLQIARECLKFVTV